MFNGYLQLKSYIISVLFRIIEKYHSDSVDIVPIIIYTISEREV